MTLKKTVALGSLAWVLLISGLHAWLNLGSFRTTGPQASTALKVGYIPVT